LERVGVRFTYPKPLGLIQHLVTLYAKPGDIVMDSFCGSGTTGHAVLQLNSERNCALHFILVELEKEVVASVTAPRLRAAITGYTARRGEREVRTPGLGGGYRYCTLSHPIFDENGQVHPEVSFSDLAAHVFFTETGEPIPRGADDSTPLIGVCRGTAYYLLFNGVLRDKRVNGGNVLTRSVLAALPEHDGPKVIYGTACRLSPGTLKTQRITFRQIPYQVRIS
jgi:hypothetical protein